MCNLSRLLHFGLVTDDLFHTFDFRMLHRFYRLDGNCGFGGCNWLHGRDRCCWRRGCCRCCQRRDRIGGQRRQCCQIFTGVIEHDIVSPVRIGIRSRNPRVGIEGNDISRPLP